MKSGKKLKVAIVCDWLTGLGGAEMVVLQLHRMFPSAPIYTSQYDPSKIDWFANCDVRTTWINRLPRKLKKALPVLRALSFSKLDLSDYDLVISSSSAEAKSVKTSPNAINICYCHSPTHYYWTRYEDYMENPGWGKLDWLARSGLKLLVGPMKRWDYRAAQKPDYLIANSSYTEANILKYYGRDSTVIHPPVEINRYMTDQLAKTRRNGFVITGRQTPYKRVDLAVMACTKLSLDLTVIGDGPDNAKLRAIAGPTIKFLGRASDSVKVDQLQQSRAFILPNADDFGISAVEALAAGTPVIAYRGGGALDYITSKNGIFFDSQTVEDLSQALIKFKDLTFNHSEVAKTALKFSPDAFSKNLSNLIRSLQDRR